ncbi:glycosyltransferase family 2 protein [Yersinia pseudotuberculosis]|uniref:Putative glycosyl transferase n=1 Tax=Yersinia pseudotuberculosis TaxID=633 RepID=F1CLM1_YERPU|nr:glycosyltransferase family 2 protein [Yersinia pseudotuberculosis]ADX97404.1 putative glycosyl transferase [Yersinia pseudotuberculosis]CFV22452.1 glycosyl transferase family protein [Yersinia pseudotuberculosis]
MINDLCVSIIIATYNVEKCISRCLDSILKQSYENFEVIIMDGASTDNSIEIIKSYNDPRLRIFSEPDNGIYDAWNKGLEKSKGNWIAFIGADDKYSSEESLALLIQAIPLSNNAPVIYGKIENEGPEGNVTGGSGEPWFNLFSFSFNYIKCNLPIPIMSAMYSREFIKDEVFDITLKVTADADLFLRCLQRWNGSPPYFINESKPLVRMGYGGVSTNYRNYIVTLKDSIRTRKKNNISNVNLAIINRIFKVYTLSFIGYMFGDSFISKLLIKYHRIK